MLKKSTAWTVFIYGTTVTVLGIYGYYQAGSKMSLYAGSLFGVLLVISSLLILARQKWGGGAALLFTLLLTAMFAFRYSVTGKPVPAIMAVISGGMLLFLLTQLGRWRK